MELRFVAGDRQNGLSLVGFLFVIVIVAFAAVMAMKVVPTVAEYMAIKKAILTAQNAGSTPQEIEASFEKQRTTAYIDSITAKDLEITQTEDGYEVGVAYQKKIELVGPVSLVIDYVTSTGKTPVRKPR